MRSATAYLLIWTALTVACAPKTARVIVPSITTEGCPAVLLTRSGGLGFETQGGVLVAIWPSGTIIRAETPSLPSGYLIGRLSPEDIRALRELAESAKTWEQPVGTAVLEMPDDILTLRRGQDVRQWSETPGFTTTPTVAQFRSRLFSLPVEGAKRFDQSLKEVYECSSRR